MISRLRKDDSETVYKTELQIGLIYDLVVGYLKAIIAFPAFVSNLLLFFICGTICLIGLDIMLSDILVLLSNGFSYLSDLLF